MLVLGRFRQTAAFLLFDPKHHRAKFLLSQHWLNASLFIRLLGCIKAQIGKIQGHLLCLSFEVVVVDILVVCYDLLILLQLGQLILLRGAYQLRRQFIMHGVDPKVSHNKDPGLLHSLPVLLTDELEIVLGDD